MAVWRVSREASVNLPELRPLVGLPGPQSELMAKGLLPAAASTLASPALPAGPAVTPGAAGLVLLSVPVGASGLKAWGVLGLPLCSPLPTCPYCLPSTFCAAQHSTLCSAITRKRKLGVVNRNQDANLCRLLSWWEAVLGPRLTHVSVEPGERCDRGGHGTRMTPSLPLSKLSCPPQVAAKAGVYEILNQLGFPELESTEDQPFSRLRCRWQEQNRGPELSAAGDFL